MVDGEAVKQSIAGVFDRASESYDRTGVEFFGAVGRTLVDLAGPRPGDRVLDLGCGRGAATLPAAERVGPTGRVLALDLAPGMVSRLRADVGSAGLHHVACRVGDAEDPDVEPGSWDVVLASLVLFFLPDPARAVRSYHRLLRPEGRLGFSWFAGDDPRWDPVFEALVAELPDAAGRPRRPGQEGPFRNRSAVTALVAGAGFRSATEVRPVTVRYADEATWWSTLWSHGVRGTMERLRAEGVLESTRARISPQLDGVRASDGALEWVPEIAWTVAKRDR